MLVLYVISSVWMRDDKARERWGTDARGDSSQRSEPLTTLASSTTSLPQQVQVPGHLELTQDPQVLGCFVLLCFVFASERWEADVLLVLPTLGELEISMNFTSYYHKLGKRSSLCQALWLCNFLSSLQQPSGRGCALPISPGHSPFYYIPTMSYCKNLQLSALAHLQTCVWHRLGMPGPRPLRQSSASEKWKLGDKYLSLLTSQVGAFSTRVPRVPLWD